MVARFTGTVATLAPVDVADLSQWIAAIDFSDWHQQSPTQKNQLRPAMMTDHTWHGFRERTDALVVDLMGRFPRCRDDQRMLSVVMPGDTIPMHVDEQPDNWVARVHVPLIGDPNAVFCVSGEDHTMAVGYAYLVNTLAPHGVRNEGASPRIHFMFDVRRQ